LKQFSLFQKEDTNLVNLKEASIWASKYLRKEITTSNISYLIQYGRVNKYIIENEILINIMELKNYYDILNKKMINNKKLNNIN